MVMVGGKKTILVVDDQPGIRRLLAEVLQEEGYDVVLANNGLEALDCVQKITPALILMDMKMPGMDGLEALRGLRKYNLAEKVILMTAYGELEVVNEAKRLGACDYVIKPFDIVDICKMVGRYLTKFGE